MASIHLTRCDRALGGYVIRWRADTALQWQAMLAKVKKIRYADREYLEEEKSWWIADAAMDRLWCYFDNAQDAEAKPAAPPTVPTVIRDAYRLLYLAPDAPLCVAKAAYRALAKVYHADAGGNEATMKRLNIAYDALTEWFGDQAAA